MKEHTSEEIKYRLSDLGVQIGNIAIEYITDLERKLEQTEKDLADYQFNYPKIKELEEENNKLLDVINGQDVKIADLEKQIEQIEKVSDYNADQLTKAKGIIDKLLKTPRTVYKRDEDSELRPHVNIDYFEIVKQAGQLLKEIEK